MGKIFPGYSLDKRLISRIYKELQKLKAKEQITQLINGQMNEQFSKAEQSINT
jgi:hypothetical protein